MSEDAGALVITVQRLGDPDGSAYVEYRTLDQAARADSDYLAQRGSLAFFGETNSTIEIPILNDAFYEGDEMFYVELVNPNPLDTRLGPRSFATVTIVDDEPSVTFSAYSYGVSETSGVANIMVERCGSTNEAFSVDYRTTDWPRSLAWIMSVGQERSRLRRVK